MSADPGREQRELLESAGRGVFEAAVLAGWLEYDDTAYAKGKAERAAADLLVELGLLRLDPSTQRLYPVDPSTVQAQVVVPLSQQGAGLLDESARWAAAFAELGLAFRSSPHASTSPITEIHGIDKINSFIAASVTDCRHELLTAQPYGKRRAATLAQAEQRDRDALARGVRMRTLYQHSARHSPATREHVAEIAELGGEVRTLDEFFKRLIVFDGNVALIPATESHEVAVAIHDRSLVAYLVDIFDRAWERAMPFTLTGGAVERSIASDVRAMTLRMLAEGHSDAASAKRLGVSTRTYAGYIAALKDEYGVETRFQLGWAMGQAEGKLLVERPSDERDAVDEDVVSF